MNKIVLASNNAHKVEEISDMLRPFGYEVLSMAAVGLGDLEIEETGETFEENARIKALAIKERLGGAVLADDSGLEVDALNGEPGVYSARYAGEPKSDSKNNEKLLKELRDVKADKRTGRFVTVLVLIDESGEEIVVRGTVEGVIAQEARGENGFGYDPLFEIPSLNKTFAELTADEKNAMSHRGNALNKLLERLKF